MFGKKQKNTREDYLRDLRNAMREVKELEKVEKMKPEVQPEPTPPKEYDEPEPKLTGKQKEEIEVVGKYLLRDLPLFKYEFIAYIVVMVVAVMLYVLDRANILAGISRIALIPAIGLPLVIWFIKWQKYMPRKNRVPSLRIYKSGVVELGLENITKGYITYGKGDTLRRKYITRLAKHTEASTGKPFLVTTELHGENINLLEENKPDMRSEEFNAILETEKAVTTKNVMARMMKFAQPGLGNPMMMLVFVNIAMTAVVLAKLMNLIPQIGGG